MASFRAQKSAGTMSSSLIDEPKGRNEFQLMHSNLAFAFVSGHCKDNIPRYCTGRTVRGPQHLMQPETEANIVFDAKERHLEQYINSK